jgi:hypothetical protein
MLTFDVHNVPYMQWLSCCHHGGVTAVIEKGGMCYVFRFYSEDTGLYESGRNFCASPPHTFSIFFVILSLVVKKVNFDVLRYSELTVFLLMFVKLFVLSVFSCLYQTMRETGCLPTVALQSEREVVPMINTQENILNLCWCLLKSA